jgi:hypothetical protein
MHRTVCSQCSHYNPLNHLIGVCDETGETVGRFAPTRRPWMGTRECPHLNVIYPPLGTQEIPREVKRKVTK